MSRQSGAKSGARAKQRRGGEPEGGAHGVPGFWTSPSFTFALRVCCYALIVVAVSWVVPVAKIFDVLLIPLFARWLGLTIGGTGVTVYY